MKTFYFKLLVAIAALCCGQSLHAQYANQGAPAMMPAQQMVMPMGQPGMVPGMQPGAMMARAPMMGAPMGAPMGTPMLGGPMMGAPATFIPASPAFAPPSQVVPAGAFGVSSKGGKGCSGCGGKGGKCCSPLGWDNDYTIYGEFLYLRARDAEVAWGIEIDSNPQNPTIQVSPLAVADFDFQPGFRFGVAKTLNDCTRVSAEYTMWEAGSTDAIQRNDMNNVIRSLVEHPSVLAAPGDHINGTAQYDMSLDIVDVALQRAFYYDNDVYLSWLLGVRVAQAEQQFNATYLGQIQRTVDTDIDFNGVGVRFGLDGEFAVNCQWSAYGKLFGAIVPGEFSTTYTQIEATGPNPVINTGWDAGRVVTMWDLELGVARVSRCKNYRVTFGYTFSAWTNMVQTDEWINGVRTNNFIGMDDTTTFDGLVARLEARY